MPATFISYNKQDHALVEHIEQAMRRENIATWREKGELYGDKGRPKAIGEAIAAHENFLVVWSKNSAISHIVEFEWNMAMLLKREIIAVILDGAALRENMLPNMEIPWVNFDKSALEIVQALRAPSPDVEQEEINDILKKLSRFNETKPAQVTRKMRIVYFNSRIKNPHLQF